MLLNAKYLTKARQKYLRRVDSTNIFSLDSLRVYATQSTSVLTWIGEGGNLGRVLFQVKEAGTLVHSLPPSFCFQFHFCRLLTFCWLDHTLRFLGSPIPQISWLTVSRFVGWNPPPLPIFSWHWVTIRHSLISFCWLSWLISSVSFWQERCVKERRKEAPVSIFIQYQYLCNKVGVLRVPGSVRPVDVNAHDNDFLHQRICAFFDF